MWEKEGLAMQAASVETKVGAQEARAAEAAEVGMPWLEARYDQTR
jgi:hypothetical protein